MKTAKKKNRESLLTLLDAAMRRISELEGILSTFKRLEGNEPGNNGQYQALVESTEDSIFILDNRYRYVFMNKKHMSRLGITEHEYLGKSYTDYHLKETSGVFLNKLEEVFRTGISLQFQHRSHRNGKYFLRTLSPINGADSETIAVAVISKDINEIKHVEFERDKIIFELQKALSQIKTLKGLIPICAWCKNIRNDQGYWQKIENYIKEHSEADFTHGICEECLKKVSQEDEQ